MLWATATKFMLPPMYPPVMTAATAPASEPIGIRATAAPAPISVPTAAITNPTMVRPVSVKIRRRSALNRSSGMAAETK